MRVLSDTFHIKTLKKASLNSYKFSVTVRNGFLGIYVYLIRFRYKYPETTPAVVIFFFFLLCAVHTNIGGFGTGENVCKSGNNVVGLVFLHQRPACADSRYVNGFEGSRVL